MEEVDDLEHKFVFLADGSLVGIYTCVLEDVLVLAMDVMINIAAVWEFSMGFAVVYYMSKSSLSI
jgi:hypothetical protein